MATWTRETGQALGVQVVQVVVQVVE